MNSSRKSPSDAALGAGAVGFMVVCCAVMPALLAAGTLGAVGAFLRNPLVVVAALVVAVVAIARARRRRSAASPTEAP